MISDIEIEFLKKIIKNAGTEILKFHNKKISVTSKFDKSPLSEADLVSNNIICKNIRSKFKKIPIVSEENNQRKLSDYFFLIDPLDGTKEFLNGGNDFTVNIALISKGVPLFGFIYIPKLDKLYWNDKNYSYVKKERKKRIISRKNLNLYDVELSRSHSDNREKKFLKKIKINKINYAGSSLKMCNLAEGKSNIYPRYGKTMEWDIAAGHSILRKAGGDIFISRKEFLNYGKKDFTNKSFLALGSKFDNIEVLNKFILCK